MPEPGSQDELQRLATRLTTAHGAGLFPALAQYLAGLLHADEVIIGEAADALHARTLGVSQHGQAQPNYEFPLAGTACESLVRDDAGDGESTEATATDGVGYFGMTLRAEDGAAIGFLCARSTSPLALSEQQHALASVVATLLAAELQLQRAQRRCANLDSEVHRLKAELEIVERGEITAAASGQYRALPPVDLDNENTGLHHVQREHILRVLNATRWVIEGNAGAALKLGMKPATLRHRMKKLGIARIRTPPL